MPADTFSNFAASTLSAAITTTPAPGTTETWNITSTASFAQGTGQSRYLVPANADGSGAVELVIGTTPPATGTTLVVSRGAEGTTPITHASGAPITEVVTRGSMQAMEQTVNKGVAGGYAPLDGGGHVPLVNLPPARPVKYIVAASNALAPWKSQADFVCTGTNDDAVIQTAINDAYTNGARGGSVELSDGVFSTSATITLRDWVKLNGQGPNQTWIQAASDFGSGHSIIQVGTNEGAPATLSDIGFRGPNFTRTLGVSPCNMDGILTYPKAFLQNVITQYFHSGIATVGDHERFINIYASNNYYGVDWPMGLVTGQNQQFLTCDFTGNVYSALHCTHPNFISGCVFVGTHLGFGPYGIVRDDSGGTATGPAIIGCMFLSLAFEAIGNAAFYDKTAASQPFMRDSEIFGIGFSWSPTYKYGSEDANYAVKTAGAFGGDFPGVLYRPGYDPFTAGAIGTFNQAIAQAQLLSPLTPNAATALGGGATSTPTSYGGFHYVGAGAPPAGLSAGYGDLYFQSDVPAIWYNTNTGWHFFLGGLGIGPATSIDAGQHPVQR